MEGATPTPSRSTGLLQLAAFLALALGLPALVPHRTSPHHAGSRGMVSVPEEIRRLEAGRPEIVIVGDSMVPCRVDPAALGRQLGKPTSLLVFHGTASATWFLLVKNVVAAMDPKPRWVVVFFRDNHFHFPAYRTTGQRQALLDSLRVGAEPELDAVLSGGRHLGNPLLHRASDCLDAAWRIDGYQEKAASRVRGLAFDLSSLGRTRQERDLVLDRIFRLENLRRDLAGAAGEEDPGEGETPAFTNDPAASFLPHLEKVTREAGMRLCLYRVKRQLHAHAGYTDPPQLAAYIDDLRAWARQHGVAYADETTDPALNLEFFADGDHTKLSERPVWTQRVGEHLRAALHP
jgi:hypothetical protein